MENKLIKESTKLLESNIIGCFFDNPELFLDYEELTFKDFLYEEWQFFFAIGKKLAQKGLKSITQLDVDTFIKQSPIAIQEKYNKYDGFEKVEDVLGTVEKEKIHAYVDDLKKWSAFYQINNVMNIKEEEFKTLGRLDLNQLYDYYTAKFNNIFININEDVTTCMVDDGLDELIESSNKGMKKGLPIDSPILSSTINGINLGAITLIAGQSGSGKSTFLIQQLLVSVFKNEEPAVFFLNEQDASKFKQELLTWIINNVVLEGQSKKFNKIRWRDGGFTPEEFTWLKKGKEILEEKTKNNKIVIVEFKTYNHKTVVRSIKKYSAMGIKIFAIDTFKLSADADNSKVFWLNMQEQMKELDDLVKASNLNVALVCTLQLGKGSILNRYLSANDLGMSKNVIDVASVCLLLRKMHSDEFACEKNELKVVKPIQGTTSTQQVHLDSNKRHTIVFVEKNRFGTAQEYQIVAQHDFGTFVYNEIGITNIPINC